ncbi:MAG TPA: SET domain-containing protein [Candidatus Paceibacterota bacterium]|nr:SET domain-containing protein [Candidatus Paceibacterota bacterium]
MLTIQTAIHPSPIAGIGLFADEFVPKGTIVWKYNPELDLLFSEEQINALSSTSKKQFFNYAFLDKKYRKYMLCGDDARFFNHFETPNCDDAAEDITIALRDIQKGEELTVNYLSFYGDMKQLGKFI